jgi:hypothetical protein
MYGTPPPLIFSTLIIIFEDEKALVLVALITPFDGLLH